MKFHERHGRIAAIVLLLVMLATVESFVVEPLSALYAAGEKRLALLSARAGRVSVGKINGPELQIALAALEQSGQATAVFWPGATDAVAAAGLQEKMRALVQEAGASIDQTEALPPVAEGALRRISLRVRFSADIDQVERVVHAAESMKPSLVVGHLSIHTLNSARADAPGLAVELQVFGLAEPSQVARPGA